MNLDRKCLLATVASLLAMELVTLAACGNGDDTVAAVPPPPDAGAPDATVTHDASRAGDSAAAADTACGPDAPPTPGKCNACATPASDPYNACSSYVGACYPFDAARVPPHPTL